jgi:hypothetical protein
MPKKHNTRRYRSGLEREAAAFLKVNQKKVLYEKIKIEWEDLRYRTYTPDFELDNGIFIETKGIFDNEDRRKHLAIKEQHPELDYALYLVTLMPSYIKVPNLAIITGVIKMAFCGHTG